jgi:hypothetical protein
MEASSLLPKPPAVATSLAFEGIKAGGEEAWPLRGSMQASLSPLPLSLLFYRSEDREQMALNHPELWR